MKFAAIAMGVLIVLGTSIILVTIVKRTMSGPLAPGKAFASVLDEPQGTAIASVAAAGDRLAIQLRGGGADRIVLVDPVSGTVLGRVALAR